MNDICIILKVPLLCSFVRICLQSKWSLFYSILKIFLDASIAFKLSNARVWINSFSYAMHILVFLTFVDTCIRFKSTQMLTAQVMLKGLQKKPEWTVSKNIFFNYVLLFNIFMKITDTFLLNVFFLKYLFDMCIMYNKYMYCQKIKYRN